MTITKRNKIHRNLAYIYASLQQYLGRRGTTPAEVQSHEQRVTDHAERYRQAMTLSVPELRRRIDAARTEIRRPGPLRPMDGLLLAACDLAQPHAGQFVEARGDMASDVGA